MSRPRGATLETGRPSGLEARSTTGADTASAVVALIGFGIAVTFSWNPSLWYDEAATVSATMRSWPEFWRMLTNVDAAGVIRSMRSIIRLRSDQITQQEIAYYFVALALGLLAGVHPEPVWVAPTLSALILTVMFVVDSPHFANRTRRHSLTLDSAYLNERELIASLEQLRDAQVKSVDPISLAELNRHVRLRVLPAARTGSPPPIQSTHANVLRFRRLHA